MMTQTSFGGLLESSFCCCGLVAPVVVPMTGAMMQTPLNGQIWCVTTNDY